MATILSFIGGFMVGWPIGSALSGKEPNWAIAAAGGGFVLIAIPLNSAYKRHAREAVKIYNREEFKEASRRNQWEVRAGRYGLGLGLRF